MPPPAPTAGSDPKAQRTNPSAFFCVDKEEKTTTTIFFFLQLILSVRILPITFFPTQFARFNSTNGVKKKEQVTETGDDYIYINHQNAQVEALQNL